MLPMKTPAEKNKAINLTLNESILNEMDFRRAPQGLSRSAYVRLALRSYFRKEDNEQK